MAICDLNLAIASGQYPADNIFKLHQRLAKAHESLQNYQLAANSYEKLIESTKLSKMPSDQKQKTNNEARKCMLLCKDRVKEKSFTSFAPNTSPIMGAGAKSDFPMYQAAHLQIENASGSIISGMA